MVVRTNPTAAPTGLTVVIRIKINPTSVPSAMITPSGAPTLRIFLGNEAMAGRLGWATTAAYTVRRDPSLSSVCPVE